MRSDASRASPRSTAAAPGPASSSAEVRGAAPPEVPIRRVVVESSGRRSTALHHLLGAIVRSIADDDGVHDEVVAADREKGSDAAGAPGPGAVSTASGRVAPVTRRRRATRGSDPMGSRRKEAADGIWSKEVTDVQGPWSLGEAGMKIDGLKRIPRVAGVQARAAAPGHAAIWLQRGVFGALAVAIALFALLSGTEGDDVGAGSGAQRRSSESGKERAAR